VNRKSNKLMVLWDDDNDGASGDNERATLIASSTKLNHGIAIDERRGFLYASTCVFSFYYLFI
jgi:hypothetical protein